MGVFFKFYFGGYQPDGLCCNLLYQCCIPYCIISVLRSVLLHVLYSVPRPHAGWEPHPLVRILSIRIFMAQASSSHARGSGAVMAVGWAYQSRASPDGLAP